MHRARRPALVAATVFLAAVLGCSTDNAAEPAGTAVASTPVAPTPDGSPSPAATGVIASSALLQPEDLGGAELTPLPQGEWAHLRPARPCDARYPSDATRTAAVAMRAQVRPAAGHAPVLAMQYVALHPGRATPAFADIAAALRRCPGNLEPGQHKWETAGTGIAGDESMLLRVSQRFPYGDDEDLVTTTTPVVVARVGDYVTVVADLGWETSSGDEKYVRQLAATAVERLRTNG